MADISKIVTPNGDEYNLKDPTARAAAATMTGASSSADGAGGTVPAPLTGDQEKFLRGDGTWADGGHPMVVLTYGTSTWQDFIDAYNGHYIVYCNVSGRMAFMAWVNNNGVNPTQVEFQYYRSVSSKSETQQGDETYVYKLTNSNGGTWTTTTRQNYTKIAAGTNMATSYSGGTLTLNASFPPTPPPPDMVGATELTDGSAGLAPAPLAGQQARFLRGDGTWAQVTAPSVDVMTGATASTDGASGLAPAPVAGQQARFLRGDATWAEIRFPPNPVMVGATASTGGASGLAPAPAAGDQDKVLMGSGQWVQNGNVRVWRGVCDDHDGYAYEATVPGLTALSTNDVYQIYIDINTGMSGSDLMTLNINSLGSYNLRSKSGTSMSYSFKGQTGTYIDLAWDGTEFVFLGCPYFFYSAANTSIIMEEMYYYCIIQFDEPISIPAQGTTVRYNCYAINSAHRVSSWGFSSSAENSPPCSLKIETYDGYFLLTNVSGSTNETINPVFLGKSPDYYTDYYRDNS